MSDPVELPTQLIVGADDSEFVMRAVKNHGELVAALNEVTWNFAILIASTGRFAPEYEAALDRSAAVLKKAVGKAALKAEGK